MKAELEAGEAEYGSTYHDKNLKMITSTSDYRQNRSASRNTSSFEFQN